MNYKAKYKELRKLHRENIRTNWEEQTELTARTLSIKLDDNSFNADEWQTFKTLVDNELQAIKEMEFGTEAEEV